MWEVTPALIRKLIQTVLTPFCHIRPKKRPKWIEGLAEELNNNKSYLAWQSRLAGFLMSVCNLGWIIFTWILLKLLIVWGIFGFVQCHKFYKIIPIFFIFFRGGTKIRVVNRAALKILELLKKFILQIY